MKINSYKILTTRIGFLNIPIQKIFKYANDVHSQMPFLSVSS